MDLQNAKKENKNINNVIIHAVIYVKMAKYGIVKNVDALKVLVNAVIQHVVHLDNAIQHKMGKQNSVVQKIVFVQIKMTRIFVVLLFKHAVMENV